MNNAPLWYLPCALIIVIAYSALNQKFSRKTIAVLGIVLNTIYWTFGFCELLYAFPFEIPRAIDLFAYYSIGALIAEKKADIEKILDNTCLYRKEELTLKHVLLLITIIVTYASGYFCSQFKLFNYPIISIVLAILGIIGTICISYFLKGRVVRLVGNETLAILCMHSLVYRVVVGVLSILLTIPSDELRAQFPIVVIIICITFCICISLDIVYKKMKTAVLGMNK